jgi:hypothetical protein
MDTAGQQTGTDMTAYVELHGPLEPAFDLIPASCEASNLRSLVSAATWDRIRRVLTADAGGRCELCGRTGRRVPDVGSVGQLAAHELWR